jgi:hypothetical protein
MNKLTVRMTKDQMRAVLSLADDQIFRLRFIDRKIPGYKYDAQKLESGVLGVEVLRQALKGEQGEVAAFAAFNPVAPAKD